MTKYIVLIGDGMADYPLPDLDGKTPLEVARTPNMDLIASCRIGLVKTIPEGMEPGSDVANLALLGYDPAIYHTGRGPLEAASMGVPLNADQMAFRMNLVTLSGTTGTKITMLSHSAGELSTREGNDIVADLKKNLENPHIQIHPGVAYRHLLVWENGPENVPTIPPHDVLDQDMVPYLFENDPGPIQVLIRSSWRVLEKHPVNLERKQNGRKPANSIWLWGQGKAPQLPSFFRKFGLSGAVISAVDLLKGIGVYAGLRAITVQGATGYLNSNFNGKVEAALEHLRELDFIFLHVEAPDEAGHHGDIAEKIEAIEVFDAKIVGPILEGLRSFDDFRVMVASDHLTPISLRTHTADPTTFAWATKDELKAHRTSGSFTESAALKSGLFFENGYELMPAFLATSQ